MASVAGRAFGREPAYRVIFQDLNRRIAVGDFQVGDWLPSESELEDYYGVSRTPVRRALLGLEQVGLIERMQGRGSLVRARHPVAVQPMMGFSAELRSQGHDVEPRLLEARWVPCPEDAAARLALEAECPVPYLRRLLVVDGKPGVLIEHYVHPTGRIDVAALSDSGTLPSVYGHLAHLGFTPASALESAQAVSLEEGTAALLEQKRGTAVLRLERITFLGDGSPIEFSRCWVRPDCYSLDIELRRSWG